MVRFILAFRYFMLVASLGAAIGAALMFWQGATDLVSAVSTIGGPAESKGMIAYVMHATDAILFGIVLIIFAYAIAFGCVLDLSAEARERLPIWMRVESVRDLKQSLIEVVLVYMVVHVATDWEEGARLDWSALVKPASILLIAGTLRLLSPPGEGTTRSPSSE